MQFYLIDRITKLEPGKEVVAIKALAMAEEYLADHFPSFPVMPGVLMIEAMTQATAWLIRSSEDFAHSMVVLNEAKNVKYGKFVEPGQTLEVSAKVVKHSDRLTSVKAVGKLGDEVSVRAQLTLERYNLADTNPNMRKTDLLLVEDQKKIFSLIWRPEWQQ
jgi:3-hydroxyacyl-[acyl-carrier-protein] dehydratase